MSATEGKLSQEELIKAIESMSVLDLAELVKGLEARFGVTAAAPVAVAAAPAAGGGAAAPAEEKTAFDVILASAPADKKIQVIKVVRELTSPRPEGSQGPRGGRAEAGQDRGDQGRSRYDEEEARRKRRQGRNQVRQSVRHRCGICGIAEAGSYRFLENRATSDFCSPPTSVEE